MDSKKDRNDDSYNDSDLLLLYALNRTVYGIRKHMYLNQDHDVNLKGNPIDVLHMIIIVGVRESVEEVEEDVRIFVKDDVCVTNRIFVCDLVRVSVRQIVRDCVGVVEDVGVGVFVEEVVNDLATETERSRNTISHFYKGIGNFKCKSELNDRIQRLP